MVELQANPNPETLKIVIWLLFVFCGILLAITGYFINDKFRRQDNDMKHQDDVIEKQKKEIDQNEKTFNQYLEDFAEAQKNQMEKMSSMITAVKDMVTSLDKTVVVMQKGLEERDPRTERQLNDHSNSIKDHEKRLGKIEAEHNVAFCQFQQKKGVKEQ